MGVKEVRMLAPCSATVIISILDQFEEHARPEQLHEFADHLVLTFVDTFEKPGEPEWPDKGSDFARCAGFAVTLTGTGCKSQGEAL